MSSFKLSSLAALCFVVLLFGSACKTEGPACGNSVLDLGEVCDDGNAVSGDHCNATCTSEEVCGNGIVDLVAGEQCEDNNNVSGDGCSADCLVEVPPSCGDAVLDLGEQCDDGNRVAGDDCSPYCTDEICGNSILDPGEQCEDGNLTNLDGCSDTCQVEILGGGCGDGVVDALESCDDNNRVAGDGCSRFCTDEICGSGILDPGEECEDGNTINDDGCSATCDIETSVSCGDGRQEFSEQCDDGNFVEGDGCSPYCTDEVCGNGILDPGENCEDGNAVGGDGCSNSCRVEFAGGCGDGRISGGEQCDDNNAVGGDGCSPYCFLEVCGNGFLDQGEVCEDGNTASGDGCSANCRSAEVCGNNIRDVFEACDDGNRTAGDGCDGQCLLESSTCGDGNVDRWEGCDDSNTVGGDGCSATCFGESCGNGRLDAGEVCDDGNLINSDNCPNSCRPATCGDSFIHATGEQCDDANLNPGDGCSSNCRFEACGNGVLDPNEVCDDGNTVNTDSCANCRPASCGDRFVHSGFEMCDDGNRVAGDGCSADCVSNERCGNGYLDSNEVCDDGNLLNSDACPGSCRPAFCGDGFVQTSFEGCDDGNNINNDGCSASCVPDGCGSGVVDGNEQCDEGGANGTQGASCFSNCIDIDLAFTDIGLLPLSQATMASEPKSLATADFNRDGRPDVVTSNQGSETTTVVYGLGDGRMWAPFHRTVGSRPTYVEMADVNRDLIPDAIVANRAGNSITVILGDGAELASPLTYVLPAGATEPYQLALADLDQDNDLDIVTANFSTDNVTIFANNGNGVFSSSATFTTREGLAGDTPRAIALADITGDGLVDIITANVGTDDISVLAGTGLINSFAVARTYTLRAGANGDGPTDLVLVDVTSDNRLDVVTSSTASDDITILVNDGTGAFGNPIPFSTLDGVTFGSYPVELAVGDITEDGEIDIIVSCRDDDNIAIFPGVAGGATFAPVISYTTSPAVSSGDQPYGIRIQDLDRDGHLDIITSNRGSGDASVLLGQGGGIFGPAEVYELRLGYTGTDPMHFALSDINSDGELDIVSISEDNDLLMVSVGLGDGIFTSSQTNSVDSDPLAITVADIDLDGRPDWLTANHMWSSINRGSQIRSGEFTVASYTAMNGCCTGDDAIDITTGDLNRDNVPDVVVTVDSDIGFMTMLGYGNGTFQSPVYTSVGDIPLASVISDVTGDGLKDVISVSANQDRVYLRPGNGVGGFSSMQSLSTVLSSQGMDPVSLLVADLDGNLIPDIATANYNSSDISVFFGLGSGLFAAVEILPARFGPGSGGTNDIAYGDFNGDTIADLAVSHSLTNQVSVLLGFGAGSFSAPQSYGVGQEPSSIIAEDFNRDGLDDIAVTNLGGDSLSILISNGHN